jgi:hypothetical protein
LQQCSRAVTREYLCRGRASHGGDLDTLHTYDVTISGPASC